MGMTVIRVLMTVLGSQAAFFLLFEMIGYGES